MVTAGNTLHKQTHGLTLVVDNGQEEILPVQLDDGLGCFRGIAFAIACEAGLVLIGFFAWKLCQLWR